MAELDSSVADGIKLERPQSGRRWTILLLKLAISSGLLWLVMHQSSWERASARLNELSIGDVLLAWLPLVAVTCCVGLRWSLIASAVARPVRWLEAWIVSMIGGALDQVLVMMSGEAYRIWWLRRGAPSLTRAVAGVLLDRVAGVVGIGLLVLAFFPRFLGLGAGRVLGWVPACLVASVFAGLVALLVMDRLPFGFRRSKWLARLTELSSSARKVFLSPATAIPVLAAAMTVHLGISACIFLIASGLGIRVGLVETLTVVPTVMLISFLPISVGGWGVREGSMVIGLGLVGVQSSDALLISIIYGLSAAAVGLCGAVFWLFGLPARGPRPAAP